MKSITLPFAIVMFSSLLFFHCGESDDNLVLVGQWLADDVSRKDCDNSGLNGPVNCGNDVGSGNSYSCVSLNLLENGNYTLSTNIDNNVENQGGTYSASSNNIRLCPLAPANECQDLPITASDFETMTIELPRDGACIAVISMIKVSN